MKMTATDSEKAAIIGAKRSAGSEEAETDIESTTFHTRSSGESYVTEFSNSASGDRLSADVSPVSMAKAAGQSGEMWTSAGQSASRTSQESDVGKGRQKGKLDPLTQFKFLQRQHKEKEPEGFPGT